MRPRSLRNEQEARQIGSGGFSLIELLIVVAIILIIVAIALPNFMRSRMAANEAAAVQSLRNITTAATVYSTAYGNGYPPDLATLGGPATPTCDKASLIDGVLAAGQKSGYTFTYTLLNANANPAAGCSVAGGNSFTATAIPILPGTSGQRSFFVDPSGVIRQNLTGPASATDPPIS